MGSASTDSLPRYWIGLPEPLKAKLRLGFTDRRHLLDIAGWCLRANDPNFIPIAVDALNTVIRENPLDGGMIRELLALEPVRTLLDKPILDRLQCLADHWHLPDDLDTYRQLQASRDYQAVKDHVRRSAKAQPDNLYWREQALMVGCSDSDPEFPFEVLKYSTKKSVEPITHDANQWLEALFSSNPGLNGRDCVARLGQTPWNTSLALRGHDLLRSVAEKRTPLPGSTAILLYSWNKAEELNATLASLSESDLSGASLFVLDNGSTDATAEILKQWEGRFTTTLGPEKYTTVSLPVNVGAAVARNWLMHMEAVQAHEFLCYLDDDVELPMDWLARFGAAVADYPNAGVWGCKVVDHANDLLIQSADNHLLMDPDHIMDLTHIAPNPFRLSDLHIQTMDNGSFDFLRPCASVTGCCHLFRTSTLLESGDFALQLSPSQYDDMEHDLRLCEAGLFPVYQGHLTVRHKKRTGMASHTDTQEEGSALGNKYKMQTMHTPADIAAAIKAEQRLLDEDILRKLAYLDAI